MVVDSYSESNQSANANIRDGLREQIGEALTLSGDFYITGVKFWLRRFDSPAGNVYAKLYAATGTVGTNAIPTGSILATSDAVSPSGWASGTPGNYALITFTFSTPYYAAAGDYCILVEYTGGDASNYVTGGTDTSSPSHSGNYFIAEVAGSGWVGADTEDICFYLYGMVDVSKERNIVYDSILELSKTRDIVYDSVLELSKTKDIVYDSVLELSKTRDILYDSVLELSRERNIFYDSVLEVSKERSILYDLFELIQRLEAPMGVWVKQDRPVDGAVKQQAPAGISVKQSMPSDTAVKQDRPTGSWVKQSKPS